jgi:5-methylcytosine-specific restriction endonuclease McrA
LNSSEYNAEYYKKNRERIIAKRAFLRALKENKEKKKNYHAQYHKENPHKSRQNARRRRAVVRQQAVEKYNDAQVLDLYGTTCHICNKAIDLKAPRTANKGKGWEMGLHIDHLIPISMGGGDTLSNVRPAHAICNLQKNKKPLQLVIQERVYE